MIRYAACCMLHAASRCCCKHSSKIFEQHEASVKSFARSPRHEFVTVMRVHRCFREFITRTAVSLDAYIFLKNRDTWNIRGSRVKQSNSPPTRRIRRDVVHFVFPHWQSCVFRVYTHSDFLCDQTVGRMKTTATYFAFRRDRAEQRICYSNSNLNSMREHTHILRKHPALSPRDVRCVHACLRPVLVEKRLFASGSLWWNISTETRVLLITARSPSLRSVQFR